MDMFETTKYIRKNGAVNQKDNIIKNTWGGKRCKKKKGERGFEKRTDVRRQDKGRKTWLLIKGIHGRIRKVPEPGSS